MAALTIAPVSALNSTATWHPDPSGLAEVIAMLRASTGATPTNGTQADLYGQLQKYSGNPHFNNYLAYILARGSENGDAGIENGVVQDRAMLVVRQAAGLLLKNNLKGVWAAMTEPIRGFVVTAVLGAVSDSRKEIRSVAASCMGIVMQVGGKGGVAMIVEALLRGLSENQDDKNTVTGALLTFVRVAEDKPEVLTPWLADIMEKVLSYVKSQDSEAKSLALQIINHYLLVLPKQFVARVDGFLRIVFSAASDSSDEVRAKVCAAVVILLRVHPHVLEPYLGEILPFMLRSGHDTSDKVKREAVEFWPVFCELPGARQRLKPVLEQILNILVEGITYSKEEQEELSLEAGNDDRSPDREEDMHPRHYTANGATLSRRLNRARPAEDGYEEDSEEEDEIYESGELQWSLRKSCARVLEELASVLRTDILSTLLPMVQRRVQSDNWAVRESGVLIVGALSLDCYDGMVPHLPFIIPFLTSLLSDSHAPVRSISCWTLGRYAKFAVKDSTVLAPVYERILACALHRNKKVQNAALSSLCEIVEAGRPSAIEPHLIATIDMLKGAFNRYQAINFSTLCGFVSTLAHHTEGLLGENEHAQQLITVLMVKWEKTPAQNPTLIPLLGCLAEVVRAMKMTCQKFLPAIYSGCLEICRMPYSAERHLQAMSTKSVDEEQELISNAYVVLCATVQVLGPLAGQLFDKTALETIYRSLVDPRPMVQQGACELVGELANKRIPALREAVREFTHRLVSCMNPEHRRVCINATWALGGLVMYAAHCGSAVVREIEAAISGTGLETLLRVVASKKVSKSLLDNTAVSLGRVACVVPNLLAHRLPSFISNWLMMLRSARDGEEKDDAIKGMCTLARLRPGVMMGYFVQFCDILCTWWPTKVELDDDVRKVLEYLSTGLGADWDTVRSRLPDVIKLCLERRFRI